MVGRDRSEARKQLSAAWQAAAKRLLEAGYDSNDIFETMAAIGLDRSMPEDGPQQSARVEVVIEQDRPPAAPTWLKRA